MGAGQDQPWASHREVVGEGDNAGDKAVGSAAPCRAQGAGCWGHSSLLPSGSQLLSPPPHAVPRFAQVIAAIVSGHLCPDQRASARTYLERSAVRGALVPEWEEPGTWACTGSIRSSRSSARVWCPRELAKDNPHPQGAHRPPGDTHPSLRSAPASWRAP